MLAKEGDNVLVCPGLDQAKYISETTAAKPTTDPDPAGTRAAALVLGREHIWNGPLPADKGHVLTRRRI